MKSKCEICRNATESIGIVDVTPRCVGVVEKRIAAICKLCRPFHERRQARVRQIMDELYLIDSDPRFSPSGG